MFVPITHSYIYPPAQRHTYRYSTPSTDCYGGRIIPMFRSTCSLLEVHTTMADLFENSDKFVSCVTLLESGQTYTQVKQSKEPGPQVQERCALRWVSTLSVDRTTCSVVAFGRFEWSVPCVLFWRFFRRCTQLQWIYSRIQISFFLV